MLGQHGRMLFGGVGSLAQRGAMQFDRMRDMEAHGEWFRHLILWGPRGYRLSYGNIVLPPCDPRAGAAFASPRRTRVRTDREAIEEVLAACGILRNEMRLDELAALFMPDAQVSCGPTEQLEARGRAVLEQALRRVCRWTRT
jgi:hypothetical protein